MKAGIFHWLLSNEVVFSTRMLNSALLLAEYAIFQVIYKTSISLLLETFEDLKDDF